MAKGTGFWNFIAKRYARSPVADQASYEYKLDVTRQHLSPDMDVLEIGCGTGTTALAHAPHAHHILATDFSPKMLEIARAKAKAAGVSNITFQQAAVEGLAFQPAQFDMVQGHSILHLLADKEAAIANAFRWLKPNGRFITSTVCLGNGGPVFRRIAPIGHALGILPLIRFFDQQELEGAFREAGFEIEESWRPRPKASVFIVARKP